jgi:hypothetical protein
VSSTASASAQLDWGVRHCNPSRTSPDSAAARPHCPWLRAIIYYEMGWRRFVGNFTSQHPGAFALGGVIFSLAQSCYAHEALSFVARHPKAELIVPDEPVGEGIQGTLLRNDGTFHLFDMRYYLSLGINDPDSNEQLLLASYASVLITTADLLSGCGYFNHSPEFELIYHLRNGLAHGNKFTITQSGKRRLSRYPAFLRSFNGAEKYHISEHLNGSGVLFDFVGPGDVVDILTLTAERLRQLETGILGPGKCTSIFG